MKQLNLLAGIDLGSGYIKIYIGDIRGKASSRFLFSSIDEFKKSLKNLNIRRDFISTTGHLKNLIDSKYSFSEIEALDMGFKSLKVKKGTIIDIGNQDIKILLYNDGILRNTKISRRCASGTGSFLDFIIYKLSLNKNKINSLAKKTKEYYPLNSYCTVFASYEIIEMLNKKIKKEVLVRSLFYSMALRLQELAPFEEPIILTGGVVENYPIFYEVLEDLFKLKLKKIKNPQFFQAKGAYLLLIEELKKWKNI